MEYISLILVTIAGCVLSTNPPVGYYQSSRFNDLTAGLAMDGDVNTCMETGFERGAWWATVLSNSVNVTGVTITGSATAIQVRIGSHMDYQGPLGNFGPNNLCLYTPSVPAGGPNVYTCGTGTLSGNILSVQAVDAAKSEKLRICEITMHHTA